MNPSDHTYDQPEKERARWLALCHAVECLTTHRQQSSVITLNQFDAAIKYACDLIERTGQRPYPHEQVKDAAARFKQLHESRVGKKSAKDLTVLFLAGPNPMNDLRVLTELGVRAGHEKVSNFLRNLARPARLERATLCLEGFQSPAKSAIC